MRCDLHIGVVKTGTTAIQSMLTHGREQLLRHSILFPAKLSGNRHTRLAAPFASAGHPNQALVADGAAEQLDRILSAVADQRRDRIILSSEHLSEYVRGPDVKRFARYIRGYFPEVRVVVYLRAQEEVAVSRYSTYLRGGGTTPMQLRPTVGHQRTMDYDALLDTWAGAFGPENIRPRIYDRNDLAGGDVAQDFVRTLDLPDEIIGLGGDSNAALAGEAQIVMREVNGRLSDVRAASARRVRRTIAALGEGPPLRPSRGEAKAFRAAFEESNEAVRRKWFPERETLFPDRTDRFPEVADGNDLSHDRMLELMTRLCEMLASDDAAQRT